MSQITGHGGSLNWCSFPIPISDWEIELEISSGRSPKWKGRLVISQVDLQNMMNEHAKSGPGFLVGR